jgi:uncharacterized protein YceH (UPF0502 family)
MLPRLSSLEARVIGCLIEKQVTTPEQYPLSLNALTLACNQKSNRDPVMELEDRAVQETVDGLMRKHMVLERSGFGSRVAKYQQRFCNTEFGALQFSPQERAIVCELLLRGPQTAGELRTRAARMCEVSDVAQIETALEHLMQFQGGPCVARLGREPGKREARYAHLFSGEPQPVVSSTAATTELDIPVAAAESEGDTGSTAERLAALEREVQELRAEVRNLQQALRGPTATG